MSQLPASYGPDFVGLSILIAVLASGAALDLAGRVTATHGRLQASWLAGGGLVMGLGIWAMHFTGMLAFTLPVPVRYHWPTVLLSLVAAILASVAALFVASRERLSLAGLGAGSVIMGSGIAGMHYLGMAAMRVQAGMEWNPWLVAASVVLALVVSAVALALAFRYGHAESDRWTGFKAGSALVMGAAICTMHYTGMIAARFVSTGATVDFSDTISASRLGGSALAAITVLVLVVAIALSIIDRRVMAQAVALQAAMAEVRTLRGLLPICAECKRVRSDSVGWQQLEAYVRAHTEAQFSHGICPECQERWERHLT